MGLRESGNSFNQGPFSTPIEGTMGWGIVDLVANIGTATTLCPVANNYSLCAAFFNLKGTFPVYYDNREKIDHDRNVI